MTDSRSVRSLGQAMDWIVENLDHFDPFVDAEPHVIEGAQRTSELAVAVYCCTRLGNEQFVPHQNQLSSFLERMVAKSEFSDRLLRSSGGLVLLLYIHAALRQHRKGNPDLHEMLQRVVTAGYLEQDERPPHRQMDLRLALEWSELRGDLPSWDELCDASILSHPLRIPFVDVGAAYAYTHAFFFSFAFGTHVDAPGTWFDPGTARHVLTMLMVTFCQEHDWDIVGELLLCWECAGLAETALSRRVWETFLDRQESTGAFSGPEKRGTRGTSDNGERQYFARHYHTTLVAVMALACRLAVQDRPEEALPGPEGGGRGRVEPLPVGTDLALAIDRAGAWLRAFSGDPERDTIHPRPDALCRALVISWMCEDLSNGAHGLRPVIGKMSSRLTAIDADDERWANVPAGLKLIGASLLASMGYSGGPLAMFFEAALYVLADEPAGSAEADLPLSEKRTLFHQLGLIAEPPRLDLGDVIVFAQGVQLDDAECLQALAMRVDACSGYGARTLEMPRGTEWIVDLLEAATLHTLRAHDLLRAAQYIRALSRLGDEGQRAAADCARYLLLHQQPAGQFGAFGPESRELAGSVPQFSSEADLELPVMLDSVWTLGEALGNSWRLYSALPRSLESSVSAGQHPSTVR